jgi:O-acetyl-ADP-ribose deacetylase (regulator of RNase III)
MPGTNLHRSPSEFLEVPMLDQIEIVEGDITKLAVDAIVNAANGTLMGGGGVDGAIHRAAGPGLRRECFTLGGCEVGQAKITRGYNLPARWVIHTVGPYWDGGDQGEDELLANCYRNSLALAVEKGIKTIAFPSISTGAFCFPMDRAVRIALREITAFLQQNPAVEKVILVCFSKDATQTHQAAFDELKAAQGTKAVD